MRCTVCYFFFPGPEYLGIHGGYHGTGARGVSDRRDEPGEGAGPSSRRRGGGVVEMGV